MLFFQGQMPHHTYEHSLQLLLPQQQETKCYSLRVRVDTEKTDKRFVWWLSILFSCCTDLDFRTEKTFPCAAIYINTHMHHFISILFTCIEEQSKTILPNTFSGLIRCFSFFLFMLCFCFLFRDLILLPCLYIFSKLVTVLQQGNLHGTVSILFCSSNWQGSCKPWP